MLTCTDLLVFIHGEDMGTTSLLVMITLGLDMCIGNLMPWINSLNLRQNLITYWVNISRYFNLIEVICLVSLILSVWALDYFPTMCTWVSISKWRDGKKISNFDGHSEIVERFLIFSPNSFKDMSYRLCNTSFS